MAESKGKSKGSAGRPKKPKEAGEFRGSSDVRTALIDGVNFHGRAVQYAVVDGVAMFEGDIVLGTVEEVEFETEQRKRELAGEIAAGVAISGARFRWSECRIPYEIDDNLSNQDRVTKAIDHWESRTHYRFVERTPANAASLSDYVVFRPGSGCSSAVGRRGGRQNVTLTAGCSLGNAIHEIGHVVGMWHEQSREDRDSFVTIQWVNITSGRDHNFNQHISDGDDIGAYDYDSIMHYPRKAFSKNGNDTIVPVDANAQIGQRTGLSTSDIVSVDSLCATEPPDTARKWLDDIGRRKAKFVDDPITKHKFLDDPIGTRIKALDDVKGRGLDKAPASDFQRWRRLPRGPLRGRLPFTLATPHHAPVGDEVEGAIDALAEELEMLAAAIAENAADAAELAAAYQEAAAALQQAMGMPGAEG